MSEFDPGDVIDGRYRVRSRVGAGGMADVYLAEDQQLGREVALKMLHRRFSSDPGFVERFRREAQAAASLQHPNVVSVFDRGDFGGTYYIAMEYLPGRSLKQMIREEAPIAPERAIDLTEQILKAARFAHRRGVIHRDLKPHNVIVDENDHAKVTDFGIARAGASDMTETGSIMGTAQYLSPEQAQGHAVSAPSDLYSVAVILYELLTGRVPFDGESPVAIALQHVSEAPVPPSQINPAVPPALEQVVLWSLNKNPADRPADADQFIEALEQARRAMSGDATASMPAVGFLGVAAGAAAAQTGPSTVVMPPAGAAASYGSVQSPMNGERFDRYDDDPRNQQRPRGPWPWIVALLVLLAIAGGVLAYLLTRPAKATVPVVTNVALKVAETKLVSNNLNWSTHYQHDSHAAGTVIGQYPLAYQKVDEGTSVLLTVSSGPGAAPRVTVPSVVGQPQKDAVSTLKKAGLKVAPKIVTETSSTIPKGSVTQTVPATGLSVSKGTTVTLYVSSGKPKKSNKVHVPYVVGDTLATAQQALSQFTPKVTYQTTTATPPDTVIAQDPKHGTLLALGSTVSLLVAQAPSKVPSVVGKQAPTAIAKVRNAGYKVAVQYKIVNKSSRDGEVLSQSPRGNSKLAPGSTVTLTVGRYTGGGGGSTTTTTTTSTSTTSTGTTTHP